ncbi:MAG: transglutaminaseTgpA domain-containing protein, partial [Fimbriimonadales bacterium]
RSGRLETGYALRTVFAAGGLTGIVAFLLTPLIALTAGQLISTIVVGMPFRPNIRATQSSETMPELQAGAGGVSLSKMEIMRVRLEGAAQPAYLRMESYNYYTGRGWNRGRVFYEVMFSPRPGVFTLARPFEPPPAQLVTATIRLSSGWHRNLYLPGYPMEAAVGVRDLYYVRPIGAVVTPSALGAGESYTVKAYLPTEDPWVLRETPPSPPHYPIVPRFPTQLPQNVFRPKLAALARRLTEHHSTQYDKVMALVRYIEQNTAYNLNVEAYPPEVDVVEYFLFEAKQGYCVEFATALAVLCLHADIPARVASGFILQERDPDTGEYIVREEHRHLWTEVFFNGVGWVAFDATR